jgi:hypothetical protein
MCTHMPPARRVCTAEKQTQVQFITYLPFYVTGLSELMVLSLSVPLWQVGPWLMPCSLQAGRLHAQQAGLEQV